MDGLKSRSGSHWPQRRASLSDSIAPKTERLPECAQTLLVTLAAAVAMIQVNLLLPTAGRSSDSFVMNDLMRLPLGILTGVGFIGGGAVLRRGEFATGVTTAATLWLATVIGLCFGGGQNGIGIAASALGLIALEPLDWIEHRVPRQRTATLVIALNRDAPADAEIRRRIGDAGLSIVANTVSRIPADEWRELRFKVHHTPARRDATPPPLLGVLAGEAGVIKVEWCASV